jgi:hypothetical protein
MLGHWMGCLRKILPAVSLCLIFFLACLGSTSRAQDDYGVLVDTLLRDVRDTLIRVRADAASELRLKSATLTLQAAVSVDAEGKVSLWVVSLGGGVSKEATQTITIELKPPEGGDSLEASATSDALASAILSSYGAVSSAEAASPPLRLEELRAGVKFVIAKEAGGGVDFKMLPISVEISGKVSESNVQEIELVFCKDPCA